MPGQDHGFMCTLEKASEFVQTLAIVSLVLQDKTAQDFCRSLWDSFVWADFDFSLDNQVIAILCIHCRNHIKKSYENKFMVTKGERGQGYIGRLGLTYIH